MAGAAKGLLIALVVGAVMLLAASGHGNAPSARAAFLDGDGDGVRDNTEVLLGSNPADAASTPESGGVVSSLILPGSNRCSDGIDNDRDGLIDSADPDCQDSDVDGVSDPVEQALGSNPLDDTSFPENTRFDNMLVASIFPEQLCNDGRDDDKDGLIDAADPGCNAIDSDGDGFDDITEKSLGADWLDAGSVPEHPSVNPGSCTDGIDNDHDGLTDAADPGCAAITNDNVADATVVSSLPFDNRTKSLGATTEPAEPAPNCAFDAIEGTLWYSFTASSDTPVIIDTSGSDFATLVGVWASNQFGLSEVACSNAFLLNPSMRFAFQATQGATYLVQVGRNSLFYAGAANLTIHMEAGVRPANDNFADAATIPAIPFSTSVDVVAATTETHERESSCSFGPTVNTVWWSYTPASDTYVLADTPASGFFGNILAVFQGQSIDDLTQVACGWANSGDSNDSELAFLAKAGQTYYFQAGMVGLFGAAPARAASAAGSIFTGTTQLVLNLQVFSVPSCLPPQLTIQDNVGDQFPGGMLPDIRSIGAAIRIVTATPTMRTFPAASRQAWD